MNNHKEKKYFNNWWKGFLTSILGTSNSIALTFGTTALVNKKNKADKQRLLAMMIIQDIDNSIETVRNIMEKEDRSYFNSNLVLTYPPNITDMSSDELTTILLYITAGTSLSTEDEFDDSKERIFHSSQDSWNNLNDIVFVNNVESFYKYRHMVQRVLTTDDFFLWVKPISKEEVFRDIQSGILTFDNRSVSYLEQKISEERVRVYINNYYKRKDFYRQTIETWSNLNEENKFLMNITDEDLKSFNEYTIKKEHAAKEKDIIGTWINSTVADHKVEIEYRKDHTLTLRNIQYVAEPIYFGKIVHTASVDGTWTIEGDSIITVYNPASCKLTADDRFISYKEEMLDSVKRLIDLWLVGKKQMEGLKQSLIVQGVRQARATNIDFTGNRLELTNERKGTTHYRRKKSEKKE